MKLAVVYPWDSQFVMTDWSENALDLERPSEYETKFIRGRGWCPARRHIDGCEKAISWGADLICIIGADQVHPLDILPRLTRRWEETNGIVACLIPFRGIPGDDLLEPYGLIGWIMLQDTDYLMGKTKQQVLRYRAIDPKDGELQQANIVGSGAIIFHRDVLLKVKKPWFNELYDSETYCRNGDMDSRWVMRMQVEGETELYIDTTLDVQHLDVMKIDRTFRERFADLGKIENGRSFTKSLVDYVRSSLPEGSAVVEFGSGSGSSVLAEHYDYVCVEHDQKWIEKYPGIRYNYAPILNGWYSRQAIAGLFTKEFRMCLVDGPSPDIGRNGLLQHLDFIPNDLTLIFDDVNRPEDLHIARETAKYRGQELWLSTPIKHQKCDIQCQFGVINPTNTEGLTLDVSTPGTTGSHSEKPRSAADEVLQAV